MSSRPHDEFDDEPARDAPTPEDRAWAAAHLNDDDWVAAHGEGPSPEDVAAERAYLDERDRTEACGDWLGREAERLARELAAHGDEDGEGVGP